MLHAIHLELAAVARVDHPLAMQHELLVDPGEESPCEGHGLTVFRVKPARGEARPREEHRLHAAAHSLGFGGWFAAHGVRTLREKRSRYSRVKRQAAWRLEQKKTGTPKSTTMETTEPSTAPGWASER